MSARSRQSGNTLVMLLVLIGFVVVAIALFTVNYTQLLLSNKEAKTAIDAAALQAALDLSRVVITHDKDGTYFGNVALVDDMYTDNNGNMDSTKRPVLGINTIMATIRLDALIANELKNTTMLVAAMEDLNKAKSDSTKLRKKLIQAAAGALVYDKNGKRIDLLTNADTAYDSNAIRLAGAPRTGHIQITLGTSTNASVTNIPTPTPSSLAQCTDKFYPAKIDVPASALGQKLSFKFTPSADQVTLCDSSSFVAEDAADATAYIAPTCVQAKAIQGIKSLTAMPSENPNPQQPNERKIEQMVASSCAQAGGPIRTFPSGTLQIAFPGISAPPKKVGTINFATVQGIMNSSQIKVSSATNTNPDTKMGTNSPYTGWNLQDRGAWLQTEGGAVPAVSGARVNQNWTGYRGRLADDPSVVLSFEVYDWLRHMYLRPDISSVVTAMQKPLWPSALSSTESRNDIANGLFQLAYADDAQVKYQPTFGFFKVPADGEGDPRDLRNFDKHPEEMRRQFANVFGQNTNAAGTLPAQTLLTSFNEQGDAVTVNGQPGKLLFELMDQMVNTNAMATNSMKAAQDASKQKFDEAQREEDILVDLKEQIDRKGELPELVQQFILHKAARDAALAKTKRAMNVLTNANFIVTTTLAMLNDRKLISSMGVTKASATDYQILGGDFYPISKAATVQDILGDQTISTGQDSKVKVADWASTPLEGLSQLEVFATTATPAIGSRPANDTFMQPALAATAVPAQQQNITMFYVNAAGQIQTQNPQNSMFGVNILDQQAVYQNTACLITGTSDQDIDLAWNLVDRNNGAFDHGGYWANTVDPGYNGTPTSNGIPTLIAEWTMRCPAPQFCKVNGQISSVWMTIGNLRNLIGVADSAGNISYTYAGKPINFLQTYGQVKLAHNVAVAHLNAVGAGGGQGTYINSLKNNTLDGDAASNGKVKFDVGTPGWFDRFGKPITSTSESRIGTENYNGTGSVSSGTSTDRGELRYMTSIFDTTGVVTTYTYAQLSAYNTAYFTIQQPSGCAQLYFWSS